MKKITKIIIALLAFFPVTAFAASSFAVPWQATTTASSAFTFPVNFAGISVPFIQATSTTAASVFKGPFNVIGTGNTVNFGTALAPVTHINIYSTDPPIISSPSGAAIDQLIGTIDGAEYELTNNLGTFTFGDVSNAYTGVAEQFTLDGRIITGTNLINNPNVQQIINDGSGRFGIGTSTPGTLISLGSGSTFVNLDPVATSTFGHGINIKAGCYAIAGTCIGTGGGGSGTVTSITATSPLTGGAITTSGSIGCQTASGSQAGCLSSADWNTFSSKGIGTITSLTGDVAGSGTGVVGTTLATVNGNVGSFGGATSIPNFTVNAKGLVTAAGASTPSIPVGDITGTLPIANGGSGATTNIGGAQAFGVYPIPDNGVGVKNANTVTPSYAGQFGMNRWETSPPQLFVSSSASTGAWFSALDFPGGISSVGPVNNAVAATYFQDPNLFRTLVAVNGSPAGYARNGDSEFSFINWANGPQNSGTSICPAQMHPLEYTSPFGTASSSLVNTVSSCINDTPWNRDAMIEPGNGLLIYDGNAADLRNLAISSDDDGPTTGNYSNVFFDIQQDSFKGDTRFPIWKNYIFQPADSTYALTVSGIATAPLTSAVYIGPKGQTYTVDFTSLVAGAGTIQITSTTTPASSGTMTLAPNNSVTLGSPDTSITWSASALVSTYADGAFYNPKTGNFNMSFASSSLLTLTNITGSTQCVQADTNGTLTGTGSTCGGGGGSGTVGSGTTGQTSYYKGAGTTLTATSTVFIDQTQNVGIGTSSPILINPNSLTVGGTLFINKGNQTFPGIAFSTSTGTGINGDNSGFLNFAINGTDRQTYTNSTVYTTNYSLGINTGADAQFPLQVFGTGEIAEFGSNTFTTQYIGIRNNANTELIGLNTGYTIGATAGAMFLQSQNNAGLAFVAGSNTIGATPSIVLAGVTSGGVQMGNVGVGTTSPWAVLSIGVPNYVSGTPMFAIGSSTSSLGTTTPFIVSGDGKLGIGTSSPFANLSLQSNLSTGDAFVVATSTGASIGGYDNDGHRFTAGPAPAISSCGTGTGTVVGDDQSGIITTATAATACTMTFAKAYRVAPACNVTDDSLVGFADISSISTTAVTFGISSALTGGHLYYSCSYHRN